MKFLIKRTSDWNYDQEDHKPIEDDTLVFERYTRVDTRTVNSPKKFYEGEAKWYAEGSNHRKIGSYIARDFVEGSSGWFKDINTLEELMKLEDQYGQLIIGTMYDNESISFIEIYDGYRE